MGCMNLDKITCCFHKFIYCYIAKIATQLDSTKLKCHFDGNFNGIILLRTKIIKKILNFESDVAMAK